MADLDLDSKSDLITSLAERFDGAAGGWSWWNWAYLAAVVETDLGPIRQYQALLHLHCIV